MKDTTQNFRILRTSQDSVIPCFFERLENNLQKSVFLLDS